MSENLQENRFSLNPRQIVVGAQMLFVAFGALVPVSYTHLRAHET